MKKSQDLPKISYCVFTYNEERNIERSLTSIFAQNYPKDKLEVILVDDNSTDRTVEIAKKFPVKLLYNGKKDGDLSMTMAFKVATGKYFTAVGADMVFADKNWFRKLIKPLEENPDMAVAITRYYPHPHESLVNQYLSLDPFQRDLVYQISTPNIEDVITEKKEGYYLCEYSETKIPPQVHGLYRISTMRQILNIQKIWYDMGNLILLVRNGYTKFGYVPDAGYYHFHADSLAQLLRKRRRNIDRSYLRYMNKDTTKGVHYKYFDLEKPSELFKLVLLIVSANLFMPLFFWSLYKIIRHKTWVYIIEAPLTLLLVDNMLYAFLKDFRGRKFIFENIKSLFTPHDGLS